MCATYKGCFYKDLHIDLATQTKYPDDFILKVNYGYTNNFNVKVPANELLASQLYSIREQQVWNLLGSKDGCFLQLTSAIITRNQTANTIPRAIHYNIYTNLNCKINHTNIITGDV